MRKNYTFYAILRTCIEENKKLFIKRKGTINSNECNSSLLFHNTPYAVVCNNTITTSWHYLRVNCFMFTVKRAYTTGCYKISRKNNCHNDSRNEYEDRQVGVESYLFDTCTPFLLQTSRALSKKTMIEK